MAFATWHADSSQWTSQVMQPKFRRPPKQGFESRLRELCVAATSVPEPELRRRGHVLIEHGSRLRGHREPRWPLCVPKRDVTEPGFVVDKERRGMELARTIAAGTFEGSVREHMMKGPVASVAEHVVPYEMQVSRTRWLGEVDAWFGAVHDWRQSQKTAHEDKLMEFKYASLNDIPLKHLAVSYPHMGFANVKPTCNATYDHTVLKPRRRAMREAARCRDAKRRLLGTSASAPTLLLPPLTSLQNP